MSPPKLRSTSVKICNHHSSLQTPNRRNPRLRSLRVRTKKYLQLSFLEGECSSDTEPLQKKTNYGSEDQSWYPTFDDENAPSLFQDDDRNFLKPMNRGNNLNSSMARKKPKKNKKDQEGKNGSSRGRRGKGLDFDKVFQDQDNIKVAEESEELCIIDRDAYIKGTKEGPAVLTTKSHEHPSKEQSCQGSVASVNPQDVFEEVEMVENKLEEIELSKLNPRGLSEVMPQNYCNISSKPEPNISQSLSSQHSPAKPQVVNSSHPNKEKSTLPLSSLSPIQKTHENILNMLNLQDPEQKQADPLQEDKVNPFKRLPPPHSEPESQSGSKKRIKSTPQTDGKHVVEQVRVEHSGGRSGEKNEKQVEGGEKTLQKFIPYQFLKDTGLKQRIHTQLQNLLSSEPINLEEDEQPVVLPPRSNSADLHSKLKDPLSNNSGNLCSNCSKAKDSQKRFVDFLLAELKEIDSTTSDICLDRIYCQQQTFILVNGWNPHLEGDRIRKLVSIENQNYLQSMFLKREVRGNEVDSIVTNYRLAKIVGVGGNWFGVFLGGDVAASRYSYVRMGTVVEKCREQLVKYLTDLE